MEKFYSITTSGDEIVYSLSKKGYDSDLGGLAVSTDMYTVIEKLLKMFSKDVVKTVKKGKNSNGQNSTTDSQYLNMYITLGDKPQPLDEMLYLKVGRRRLIYTDTNEKYSDIYEIWYRHEQDFLVSTKSVSGTLKDILKKHNRRKIGKFKDFLDI